MFMLNEIGPAIQCIDERELRDGNMTVLDIGANTGVWTTALLTHSGHYIDKVHMFEPMPGNQKKFEMHRAHGLFNPLTEKLIMNQCAVSNSNEQLEIHYDTDETVYASASVSATLIGPRKILLENTVSVECTSVDAYCAKRGIEHVHLIKVDVEGHEMPVFQGAANMLQKGAIDVIIYEFGTHQMARREYYKDFFDFFKDHGYENYRVRPNGWPPAHVEKYSTNQEDFSQVRSLLAVRKKLPS